jgi:uncharacterized DUF497 family protein
MQFDWDHGNIDKNLVRHGVHDWEIEEAVNDPKAKVVGVKIIGGEERRELLGRVQTNGRYLRVIFTYRYNPQGEKQVRPISATDMTKRQPRRYLKK